MSDRAAMDESLPTRLRRTRAEYRSVIATASAVAFASGQFFFIRVTLARSWFYHHRPVSKVGGRADLHEIPHLVAVIAGEEDFVLNFRKTRVMRGKSRQTVTGVVVNVKPNVPRVEFDHLKAILTNCRRHGPATQNREKHADFRAYLAGKIAHVAAINMNHGQKLWELFDKIAWSIPAG